MTDWKIETTRGEPILTHRGDLGLAINPDRAEIEAAERRANDAGRTLVFIHLVADTGGSYYYPLQLLHRLTESSRLSIGPESGVPMWIDPGYRQKRRPLPAGAAVDFADGTAPLDQRLAASFITSRGYPLPPTAGEMAAAPWFNLWQKRLWPYRELEAGSTLYWYDATERAVVWVSRVRRVEKFEYASKEEVRHRLRDIFQDAGLSHPYLDNAADRGYCLAFRVDQVRQVRVPKPDGYRFPQDGWLRCDDESAQGWLSRFPPRPDPDGPAAADLARAAVVTSEEGYFSPASLTDERERRLREVVQRRGQPEFRTRLLDAYRGRCAVTGCDAVAALEAAHITSYTGPRSNYVTNGLLLRADIHTLFDLDLIGIDPQTLTVALGPVLAGTSYGDLQGKQITLPVAPTARPSHEALTVRWQRFTSP